MNYATLEAQYRAVTEGCGAWQNSQSRLIGLKGDDVLTWLQGMVSNDVRQLTPEHPMLQAFVLTPTGQVSTDLRLMLCQPNTDLAPNIRVLVELPEINIAKITNLLEKFIITDDVEICEPSPSLCMITLQGAQSANTYGVAKFALPLHFAYTTQSGFLLVCNAEHLDTAMECLIANGAVAISDEVLEVWRIQQGTPLYGQDMDEKILAPETGLSATHICLTKGCYIGQEIVARIDSRGHTNRQLTGLRLLQGDIPAVGQSLFEADVECGRITSIVRCPELLADAAIALGYVRHEHSNVGTLLTADSVESPCRLEVVGLPFPLRQTP